MTLVALVTVRSNYSRADLIRQLLDSSAFTFIDFEHRITDDDYSTLKSALTEAKRIDAKANCLVIKDTSTSALSSSEILDVVTRLEDHTFDLAYLNKWNDYCQLNVKIERKNPERKVELIKTQHPSGIQAIIFSPSGRDIILGDKPMANGQLINLGINTSHKITEEVYNGNLSALGTIPNVFDYDIALNAIHNDDYLKANMCSAVKLLENNKPSSVSNILWFSIVVILVMVVAWAIVKIGPRVNNNQKKVDNK